jgi:hypothetical protein
MKGSPFCNLGVGGVLGVSIALACGGARAQSFGSVSASLAPPPAAMAGAPYGPAQFSMYPMAQTNGTDMLGIGSYTGNSNMFNNPFAAPLLYGAMAGMSPGALSSTASQSSTSTSTSTSTGRGMGGLSATQMGFMMLASSPQMMGINAGQMSGARGGGVAPGMGALTAGQSGRGRSAQPAGLAARYFNRTTAMTRIPQGYFNRQTRYFPESGR